MRILLREINPTLDDDTLSHVLLAPFSAAVHRHLSSRPGEHDSTRLLAALDELIDRLDR